MDIPYKAPAFKSPQFNCPRCRAFASQLWWNALATRAGERPMEQPEVKFAYCVHCHKTSLWLREQLIDPANRSAPPPNSDLSAEIRRDYNEAAAIEHESPRGAAALLRLCIQRLCKELGGTKKDINDDIKDLVKAGLPVEIQQALDVVRVIGNNAVHPGVVNVEDQPETVSALFVLINTIADRMITQPKKLKELYSTLPPEIVAKIEKRDKAALESAPVSLPSPPQNS